jgi:hypothetical protein
VAINAEGSEEFLMIQGGVTAQLSSSVQLKSYEGTRGEAWGTWESRSGSVVTRNAGVDDCRYWRKSGHRPRFRFR